MTNVAPIVQEPARQIELLMADLNALKGEIDQLYEQLLAEIGKVLGAAVALPRDGRST
jgi:hypothetical protein